MLESTRHKIEHQIREARNTIRSELIEAAIALAEKRLPAEITAADEQKLTDLLRLELDVEGYDVDVASDGASGLIRSRSEPAPDLIILDWNLPDFSGIDICQRIRAGGITIPILMLTGHDEITDRVKALDAGVDDYLIKPFSIDELMARLRAMHRRAETFSGPVNGSDVNEILKEIGRAHV